MAGLIHELMENLTGVMQIYGELTALAQEKRGSIVANDIANIKRITQLETTAVARGAKADKERAIIIKDVCQVLGRKEESLTLTQLADIIKNQPEYEAYAALVESLKAALADLSAANEDNRILVANALDYIEFNINAVRSAMESPGASYGRDGEDFRESASFLDISG
ncbi:MAG: flagellar protein FlgN [Defluviitaleaceae bacterium]|nr:flagellar protein FlgN [Defluviitaleaceae bacterium]